eukprot:53054-Chlamydomonas_euryale.AAC.4
MHASERACVRACCVRAFVHARDETRVLRACCVHVGGAEGRGRVQGGGRVGGRVCVRGRGLIGGGGRAWERGAYA